MDLPAPGVRKEWWSSDERGQPIVPVDRSAPPSKEMDAQRRRGQSGYADRPLSHGGRTSPWVRLAKAHRMLRAFADVTERMDGGTCCPPGPVRPILMP